MSEASAAVVLKLKQKQSSDQPHHKLTHRQVRKLLKKERRRSKRKEAAKRIQDARDEHDIGSGAESEDEEYLRSKNLWLMRENQIRKAQEKEAKRKSAEEKVRQIVDKRGLNQA